MATIDELVVRLDADIRPLTAALNKAENAMAHSVKRMEKSLSLLDSEMTRTMSGVAIFQVAGSRTVANVSENVRSTDPPARTTTAAFPLGAGPVAGFAGQVGTNLVATLLADSILSDDVDPLKEARKRAGEDPVALAKELSRFQASAEILERQAENTVGKGQFAFLKAAEEERLRVEELRADLELISKRARQSFNEFRDKAQLTSALGSEEEIANTQRMLQALEQKAIRAEQALNLVDDPESIGNAIEGLIDRTQTVDPQLRDLLGSLKTDQDLCTCLKQLFDSNYSPERRNASFDPGGASLGNGPSDGGVIPAVFDSGADGAAGGGGRAELAAVEQQASAWQAVLDKMGRVTPALVETRRETVNVDRAVRDLGFTFASAFEDAIVEGRSLSDVLRGLEEDILRILARTLITEPLARGLTAGLGAFTGGGQGGSSGGGLEGLVGGGFAALAGLVASPAPDEAANPVLAGGFRSGGPVHGSAHGSMRGSVHGPGGPKGDRIPALLSDGEFVVNAEAARLHRQVLEEINAGITPPAFATGGSVPPFARYLDADFSPRRPAAAPREPSLAARPVVIHIHNPSDAASFQQSLPQLRGRLRELLARAERRGE